MKSEESKKIWQMTMGSEFCFILQNSHKNSKKKFFSHKLEKSYKTRKNVCKLETDSLVAKELVNARK